MVMIGSSRIFLGQSKGFSINADEIRLFIPENDITSSFSKKPSSGSHNRFGKIG